VKNAVNEGSGALRAVAWVSAAYDLALAIPMLVAAPTVAAMMGADPPSPVINAQLNGMFALTLALGYVWAVRDIEARRGYMWIAGVFAKAAGCLLFLVDHFAGRSPDSFLLFAATDGTLALVTLAVLLRRPAGG
jgi:hypothetical protein